MKSKFDWEEVGELRSSYVKLRLDRVNRQVDRVKLRLDRVKLRLHHIGLRMDRVKLRLHRVRLRMDRIRLQLDCVRCYILIPCYIPLNILVNNYNLSLVYTVIEDIYLIDSILYDLLMYLFY